MIAALRSIDHDFTRYVVSDADPDSISVLKDRLLYMSRNKGTKFFTPITREFRETISYIEAQKKFGTSFLIFVDPVGFVDIKWEDMKRLCGIDRGDVFFTFMTYSVAINKAKTAPGTTSEQSFDDFYGNHEWVGDKTGDELLSRYVKQLQKLKKFVYTIPVYRTGTNKLYDIIIATDSSGGSHIIESIKKILDKTTTELLNSAFEVAADKRKDLTEWAG